MDSTSLYFGIWAWHWLPLSFSDRCSSLPACLSG
jgi:hypothetical protein